MKLPHSIAIQKLRGQQYGLVIGLAWMQIICSRQGHSVTKTPNHNLGSLRKGNYGLQLDIMIHLSISKQFHSIIVNIHCIHVVQYGADNVGPPSYQMVCQS